MTWTLLALAGVIVVERAFAADAAPGASGWSVPAIVAFFVGASGLVAAATTGVVKIIVALREGTRVLEDTKRIVVAGQIAAVAAGVVSAGKQQEIHLLVNSRLLVALRNYAAGRLEKYQETKADADRLAWEAARDELLEAEQSALAVTRVTAERAENNRVAAEQAEVVAGQARAGEQPDAHAQLILALEAVVAGASRDAERTQSAQDRAALQLAQDNLALARRIS